MCDVFPNIIKHDDQFCHCFNFIYQRAHMVGLSYVAYKTLKNLIERIAVAEDSFL